MSFPNNHYFRSPNLRLWWAGWTSTIYDLQRHGWEFSRHEDPAMDRFELALHHRQLRCYGKTYKNERWHELYSYMTQRGMIRDMERGMKPLNVNLAIDYRIDERAYEFMPFVYDIGEVRDTQIEHRELKSMADLHIFKPVPQDVQKVLLDDVSLSEVLEIALSKQKPMQEKIRERIRRENWRREFYPESSVEAELRLVA